MIDLGPPPLVFPKLAIIRSAPKDLLKPPYGFELAMLPGTVPIFVTGGVSSLSFVDSATSTGPTLTIPALAAAGDLAYLFDYSQIGTGTPTTVVPTGFTSLANTTDVSRAISSYKIIAAGEPGSSITGMDSDNDNKVMFVFRGNVAISTVTPSTWNSQGGGSPSTQTVTASGQTTPLVVIGAVGQATTAAFTTESPAFDATVTVNSRIEAGYKIYNSSPADHSIDAGDNGRDNLHSGYLRVA